MKKNKNIIYYLGIVLVLILVSFYFAFNFKKEEFKEENILKIEEGQYVKYKREDGSFWTIPKDEAKIDVSSNPKEFPRFVSGVIDPVDIALGQTQTTRVVIENNRKLEKVWAEIEHDNGFDKVELNLIKEEEVSFKNYEKLSYFVDEKGNLVLKDKNEKSFSNLINSFISLAKAQELRRYTYEGKWVAHSTHTRKYKTIVYAVDDLGRKANLTLAWSDPCDVRKEPTTGQLFLNNNCSLSTIFGVDDLNGLSIRSRTITLIPPTATIVMTPPYGGIKDIENGAAIVNINGGAKIVTGYLCIKDDDGDGYVSEGNRPFLGENPNSTIISQSSTCSSGYTRLKDTQDSVPWRSLDGQVRYDCLDDKPLVNPGQNNYFFTHRGDGSFDYDCNGATTKIFSNSQNPTSTGWQEVHGYDDDFATCASFPVSKENCGISSHTVEGCREVQNKVNKLFTLLEKVFKTTKAIEVRWYGWYAGSCEEPAGGCYQNIYTLCK
jgi:hypothetical protein